MSRPRIGIPVPTSRDIAYNRSCWPDYVAAVEQAGGEAVGLALDLPWAQFGQLASGCDGFVLPGSPADVDPAGYDQERDPSTAAADLAREACDRALLQHAAVQGKPVLAICFGLQILNVSLGGTLVQDLLPVPVNHSAGASVAVAHVVLVERESLLAGLLSGSEAPGDGSARRLSVNSSHHQAVGTPAHELAVVARSAEDDVVEAVEGRIGAADMLGVQWHPERSYAISAASRALFAWVVSMAADVQGRRAELGIDAGPV